MPMTNKKLLSKAETVHVRSSTYPRDTPLMIQLKILPPESDPSTFRLTTSDVSGAVPHLLEASFEVSTILIPEIELMM